MKSLKELQEIRDRAKQQVDLRRDNDGYRVVVGMATCGIAAGARPVLAQLVEKVQKDKLENVVVTQTGCIGVCRLEPVVEIYNPNGEKTTYVNMTSEKAVKVLDQHIKRGKPVTEYTIGAAEEKK